LGHAVSYKLDLKSKGGDKMLLPQLNRQQSVPYLRVGTTLLKWRCPSALSLPVAATVAWIKSAKSRRAVEADRKSAKGEDRNRYERRLQTTGPAA
jgi:hypothetical protein